MTFDQLDAQAPARARGPAPGEGGLTTCGVPGEKRLATYV